MKNSLFSAETKAQLEALKKELKNTKSVLQEGSAKPDLPVNLPSQKSIDKQVKQHLEHLTDNTYKKNQRSTAAETPISKYENIDTHALADELLFKQAMAGVTPLQKKNTVTPDRLKSQKRHGDNAAIAKRASAQGAEEVTGDIPVSDMQAMLNPVAAEAYLMYKNPTLQHRVFSQLKDGKLRWFEAVDIHGSTINEARTAVLKVIQITQDNGHTVLKIVHGKGTAQDKQAVLKTCVNGWLRQHPDVLAFCSATPKDGGTGAVVVLIKRPDATQRNK